MLPRHAADWPAIGCSCDAAAVHKALLTTVLVALVLPACRASINVNTKTEANAVPETQEAAATAPTPPPPSALQETAYFGVARSLTLKPGQRAPACSCIDAVVGNANDPAFDWHGQAPQVGPDALVIALSAEGVQCASQGRGPSIAAVELREHDVIVVIEEFRETRPLALGAIIPNPGAQGHVYLHPRGHVPYARSLANTGRHGNYCRVGEGVDAPSSAGRPTDQTLP